MPGVLILLVVARHRDHAVANRQNLRTVANPALGLRLVAGEDAAVLVDLDPVDGEAFRPLDLAVKPDQRVDVPGRPATAVRGEPSSPFERRRQYRRRALRDHHRAAAIGKAGGCLGERIGTRNLETMLKRARDVVPRCEIEIEEEQAALERREQRIWSSPPVERVQILALGDVLRPELEQCLTARCIAHLDGAEIGRRVKRVGELKLVEHMVATVAALDRHDPLLRHRRDHDRRQRTVFRTGWCRRDQTRDQRDGYRDSRSHRKLTRRRSAWPCRAGPGPGGSRRCRSGGRRATPRPSLPSPLAAWPRRCAWPWSLRPRTA